MMKKDILCNTNQKKSGVALLISDKADFKAKLFLEIKRDIS